MSAINDIMITTDELDNMKIKYENQVVFNVWAEGYRTTGEYTDATFMGTVRALTFDDAVMKLKAKSHESHYYEKRNGKWYFWGCKLFDNEQDARRSFG